jgi:hypothetical protein
MSDTYVPSSGDLAAIDSFITDVQSAPTTATPSSPLDGGSFVDWGKASLGKLLDLYTFQETARINAQYQPLPAGYFRVPGTNQVVPAGTMTSGPAKQSGLVLILMAAAAIYFAVKLAKE